MGRAEIKLFQRAAETVADFMRPRLDGNSQVKILAHTDADGISAAAILGRCLYHYDVPFSVRFMRPKESDLVKMSEEDHNLFVFLDQGSGQIESIHKHLLAKQKDVVVIDHHPGTFPKHPNLTYLNPHAWGLNGAKDVSASGATYMVVEQLDLKFRSLLGLAMIGAIGDRQEFFSGFTNVNDMLVKRAVDLELVHQGEGLKLVGRSLKPVLECLRSSTRPYLVGLSGNPSACGSLLKTIGIQHSVTIAELQPEQERTIADAIFARVGKTATNEEFQHTLWGTVYTNRSDQLIGPRDLREYAAVLDSCANLKSPETGFAMAVGDEATVSNALTLLSRRQEEMLRTLSWIVKNLTLLKDAGSFRYMYCGEDVEPALMGEALSLMIESGMVDIGRPIFGIVDTPSGELKISARGTPKLAMEGLNIGSALEKVATEVGGTGGGHDVAAAARIPKERMDEFLTKLNQSLAEAK
jgi:RecJ-like exonuclease